MTEPQRLVHCELCDEWVELIFCHFLAEHPEVEEPVFETWPDGKAVIYEPDASPDDAL